MGYFDNYDPMLTIPPYMDLGPPADYSAKRAAAIAALGAKYVFAKPINCTAKVGATVRPIRTRKP